MREIEFRGKSIKTGKFIYGLYVRESPDGTSMCIPYGIQKDGCYPLEIDLKTLGQLTGLRDCKNNKIFEGDILGNSHAIPRAVIFEEGAFRLEDDSASQNQSMAIFTASKLKIIGNKYDDPELLEDAE